jgi:hypothetical protein
LIKTKLDFEIAKRSGLVPEEISYRDLINFLSQFRTIPDSAVAKRYHYGQMRLTRLNWAVRLLQPTSTDSRFSWYYHELRYTTTDSLRDYGAIFFVIFTILSLFLAGSQVKAQLGMSPIREALTSGFADGVCFFLLYSCVVALGVVIVVWALQACYASRHRRANGRLPATMV